MDFRYLGGEEVLDLDWQDPWFSKFRNRNLWRQYDAPMNVFLYVEPYEVRVEIIARPVDVQNWVDLGLDSRGTIPVDIQEEIKQRVADFFAGQLELTVGGEPVQPELDRVNFLARTLRTSTVISPPRELDAASATLGVIFLQPTSGYPDEAAVTWRLFAPRIQKIPAAATDEAGPLRFFLQPDDNILWWRNFLKDPTMPTLVEIAPPPSTLQRAAVWGGWLAVALLAVLTVRGASRAARGRTPWLRVVVPAILLLVVAGGVLAASTTAKISDDRAEEIVGALLTNIYRAFDYRDEDIIYDTLDRSLAGDMLTETYLTTRTCSPRPTSPPDAASSWRARAVPGPRSRRSRWSRWTPVRRAPASSPAAPGTSPPRWATGATSTSAGTATSPTSRWRRWTACGRSRAWNCSRRSRCRRPWGREDATGLVSQRSPHFDAPSPRRAPRGSPVLAFRGLKEEPHPPRRRPRNTIPGTPARSAVIGLPRSPTI
jgi:hypothetical protein